MSLARRTAPGASGRQVGWVSAEVAIVVVVVWVVLRVAVVVLLIVVY